MRRLWLSILLCCFIIPAYATPPHYRSFHREQAINPDIDKSSLIRIWMIYVGQGDAILIQIPGNLIGASEPYDVLVDTGSFTSSNAQRANRFLSSLYDVGFTLENIVITHHDKDHVYGIKSILGNDNIGVTDIWHNGLASYEPYNMGLSDIQLKNTVHVKNSAKRYTRIMGELTQDGSAVQEKYLVKDIATLKKDYHDNKYQGIYNRLAKAVVEKDIPMPVSSFRRAVYGKDFIRVNNEDIKFDLLWPVEQALKIGDWGETINGNSTTFRFSYHDFEMLFTGDQNDKSEPLLVEHLKEKGQSDLLSADVLKVPHHGSSHADKGFFTSSGINPVVSMASMGKQGFETNWQHPSEKVIRYSGGSHRFYSTYIHEKRFKYDKLSKQKRSKLKEYTHILVETDGHWFRIVEIPFDELDLTNIPDVEAVTRSHGTRWIKARGEE